MMKPISFEHGLESIHTREHFSEGEHLPANTALAPQRPQLENNTESLYQSDAFSSSLIAELAEFDQPQDVGFMVAEFHQVSSSSLAALQKIREHSPEENPILDRALTVIDELNNDRQRMLNHLRTLSRG